MKEEFFSLHYVTNDHDFGYAKVAGLYKSLKSAEKAKERFESLALDWVSDARNAKTIKEKVAIRAKYPLFIPEMSEWGMEWGITPLTLED